ncbi:MAG TPA: RnfH family protein [Burkholderiales bacterium]
MKIRVEVVHAYAHEQIVIALELEQGALVADALAAARLQGLFPDGLPADVDTGIWGRPASPGSELRDRDRVEIYRPLVADPKQARRRRASLQRQKRIRS